MKLHIALSHLTLSALALTSALASCSHGPGPSPRLPACAAGPQTTLAGRWSFAGTYTEQTPAIDEGFIAPGLEDIVIDLAHVGHAASGCAEAYALHSPSFATSSGNGGPSTLESAFVLPNPAAPSGFVSGVYYFPASNVSVSLHAQVPLDAYDYTSDALVLDCEFTVYPDNCVVVGDESQPKFDDDGDGEIDEPDEVDIDDIIDPAALPISSGRMRLFGTRTNASVILPARQFHALGEIADTSSSESHIVSISMPVPATRLRLDTGELELANGLERIRAIARIALDGSILTELPLSSGSARFEGRILPERVLRGGLWIFDADGRAVRKFRLTADLSGASD